MIKIVFSDIDGCMAEFVKPMFPEKQNLEGNRQNLDLIKKKTEEHPNVIFGVATSRSYHHSDNIMRATNHIGPSIFEGGNVIYEPGQGVYFLFEEHPKFRQNIDILKEFVSWRREMELYENELKSYFPQANVRQMKDRYCMLTYEFDKDIGKELYEQVLKKMPEQIKNAIKQNILKVLFCKMAIDILPNFTKGDAIIFLLNKYNISKEDSLGIGDSSHSDLDLLDSVGYPACPSNADEILKNYIKSRKGMISYSRCTEGFIHIIDSIGKGVESG